MLDRLRDFSMTDRSLDMKREFADAPDTVMCACCKGAACDSRQHVVGWRVCEDWQFDALKGEQEQRHRHPALGLAGYSLDTLVAGVMAASSGSSENKTRGLHKRGPASRD